ncbi:MAG: tautomerase family protein [Pseudomonadota bacterium]
MPFLQLDTSFNHSREEKAALAKRFGEIFAEVMQASPNRITVAIREHPGGIWRCGPDAPREAAILMLDIRRGRPAEQRAELARLLIEACKEILGYEDADVNAEFTQHAGDEMYHTLYGGLSDEWQADTPDPLDGARLAHG